MFFGKHNIELVNNLRTRLEKRLKGCGHLGNKDKSLKDTVINIEATISQKYNQAFKGHAA